MRETPLTVLVCLLLVASASAAGATSARPDGPAPETTNSAPSPAHILGQLHKKRLVDGAIPGAPIPGTPNVDCIPRPPIHVDGDAPGLGFTAGTNPVTGDPIYRPGSGVVSGNGTAGNPYVIAGWCPTVPTQLSAEDVPAIHIEDTEAHVVVRGNDIPDRMVTDTFAKGIRIDDARNVTVADNRIERSEKGIEVVRSPGTVVSGNNIFNEDGYGIEIRASPGTLVHDNFVLPTAGYALYIDASAVTASENFLVQGDGDHTFLQDVPPSTVILSSDADGATFANNTVRDQTHGRDDALGVRVDGADDVTIAHNRLNTEDDLVLALQGAESTRIVDNVIRSLDEMVRASGPTQGLVLEGNNFVTPFNLTRNAAGLNATDAEDQIDARGNWWGDATGPGGGVESACSAAVADGDGRPIQAADGLVCFENWLESRNPEAGISDGAS